MHVTFLLYEGIEPVDLAAIGVISMAKRIVPELSYETVAARREPVVFSNGLLVMPSKTFDEVKCWGSPRTSQMPRSGSRQCSIACST